MTTRMEEEADATATTATTTITTESSSSPLSNHHDLKASAPQQSNFIQELFDVVIDLVIYIGVVQFFKFFPLRHTLLMPFFTFATFLIAIVYYEYIDRDLNPSAKGKAKLKRNHCLLSLFNIILISSFSIVVQPFFEYDLVQNIPIWQFVVTPVVWLLTQEFAFYALHRLAHNPTIYPFVHKTHHTYRITRPIYCQYNTIWETIFIELVDSSCVFLFMNPQYYLAFGVTAVIIRHNVCSHRAEVEKSNAEVGRHAMHHRDGRFNFGNLAFLDMWFGTEYIPKETRTKV
jgi:sterol desaturase/sphingolipid hydroxylase (fatty acid hydroxylase superfamily)